MKNAASLQEESYCNIFDDIAISDIYVIIPGLINQGKGLGMIAVESLKTQDVSMIDPVVVWTEVANHFVGNSTILKAFNTWTIRTFGDENDITDKAVLCRRFVAFLANNEKKINNLFKVNNSMGGSLIYGRVFSKIVKTSPKTLRYITSLSDDNHLKKIIAYCCNEVEDAKMNTNYQAVNAINVNIQLRSCPELNSNDLKNVTNDPDEYSIYYVPLEDIQSEKGMPRINFKHTLQESPYPAWYNFLKTFTTEVEAELFLAFLYSVFYAKNRGRQLLWIKGVGEAGKSTVTSVLSKYCQDVYGGSFAQAYTDSQKDIDKFCTTNLNMARLLILPNVVKRDIMNLENIMKITGNDLGMVRGMHSVARTGDFYCKVIIASNYSPFIDVYAAHEYSRLLYTTMDNAKVYRSKLDWREAFQNMDFEEQLRIELPSIIKMSEHYYQKHIGDKHDFHIPAIMKVNIHDECADNTSKQIAVFAQLALIPVANTQTLIVEKFVMKLRNFMDHNIEPDELKHRVENYFEYRKITLKKIKMDGASFSVICGYEMLEDIGIRKYSNYLDKATDKTNNEPVVLKQLNRKIEGVDITPCRKMPVRVK